LLQVLLLAIRWAQAQGPQVATGTNADRVAAHAHDLPTHTLQSLFVDFLRTQS